MCIINQNKVKVSLGINRSDTFKSAMSVLVPTESTDSPDSLYYKIIFSVLCIFCKVYNVCVTVALQLNNPVQNLRGSGSCNSISDVIDCVIKNENGYKMIIKYCGGQSTETGSGVPRVSWFVRTVCVTHFDLFSIPPIKCLLIRTITVKLYNQFTIFCATIAPHFYIFILFIWQQIRDIV